MANERKYYMYQKHTCWVTLKLNKYLNPEILYCYDNDAWNKNSTKINNLDHNMIKILSK